VAFAAYEFIIGPLLDNPTELASSSGTVARSLQRSSRTYRVIYRIDDDLQQVSVVGVLSRADAYRSR